VVRIVVPALNSVPQSGCVARGAGRGTKVGSSEGMNEGDICKHVAGARAQVAVEVPARLGAVRLFI
jgi:hypothetical protein